MCLYYEVYLEVKIFLTFLFITLIPNSPIHCYINSVFYLLTVVFTIFQKQQCIIVLEPTNVPLVKSASILMRYVMDTDIVLTEMMRYSVNSNAQHFVSALV
jgi:hypothetical protein